MTHIKEYVDLIDEELEGAKTYAEKYALCKSRNESVRAKLYWDMAQDELKHSNTLHDMAVADIEKLKEFFKPTVEMEEAWNLSHKKFMEKSAWVKMMIQN